MSLKNQAEAELVWRLFFSAATPAEPQFTVFNCISAEMPQIAVEAKRHILAGGRAVEYATKYNCMLSSPTCHQKRVQFLYAINCDLLDVLEAIRNEGILFREGATFYLTLLPASLFSVVKLPETNNAYEFFTQLKKLYDEVDVAEICESIKGYRDYIFPCRLIRKLRRK